MTTSPDRAGLDALWAEMLLDACASDGPIRDNDVRQALASYRPKIEAALAAPAPAGLLREALSDAVKRAGVDEIADALVYAFLDGTFADATEEQVRHAVYECVGRAALAATGDSEGPGLDDEVVGLLRQVANMGSCSQTHHEFIARKAARLSSKEAGG